MIIMSQMKKTWIVVISIGSYKKLIFSKAQIINQEAVLMILKDTEQLN